MANAALDEKSTRVRNLLSSYYGTGDSVPESPASSRSNATNQSFKGQPSASLTPKTSTQAPAPRSLGLDSTAFDVDRYMKQMLMNVRLPQLLQKQNQISSEVRTLDSDMQMLVYENYNKFISATDTIRTMKNSVDSMTDKMQTLQKVTGSVADRNAAVSSRLQQRHHEMEDLSNIRALLVKLQAVFELPQKLRYAQQQGAIEVAADKYDEVSELLRIYGHKGAFRRVKLEVQAVVNELAGTVRKRMDSEGNDLTEDLQLLRKLGQSPAALQEDFLRIQTAKLDSILRSRPAPVQSSNSDSLTGEKSLSAFVVDLDQAFIAELAGTAAKYMAIFGEDGRIRMLKVARDVFGRYLELLKQIFRDFALSQSSGAMTSLQERASQSNDSEVEGLDWGCRELTTALATFATDVSRLQNPLPELSAADRATEVVEKTVRYHVTECFRQLESSIESTLEEAKAQAERVDKTGADVAVEAEALAQVYPTLCNLMSSGSTSVLHAFSFYLEESVVLRSWQDVFVDLVQGQAQHLLISLHQNLRRLGEVEGPNAGRLPSSSSLTLIAARFSSFLEHSTVSLILELLANTFPGLGNAGGSNQPPAFVAAEIARQLRATSADLLKAVVQKEARELSSRLLAPIELACHKGSENPASVNSGALKEGVQVLIQIESKVRVLTAQQAARHRMVGGISQGNVGEATHSSLEPAELSGPSIMQGICTSVLRSLIELLRLQTISKSSVQHLDEIIDFLRQHFTAHLLGGNPQGIEGLIDEARHSMQIRTLEEL